MIYRRTYRNGKIDYVEVDLNWKADLILTIYHHFKNRRFTISDLKYSERHISREQLHNRLRTLHKNSWVKKFRINQKNTKDSNEYQFNIDKFERYFARYGSTDKGPLFHKPTNS